MHQTNINSQAATPRPTVAQVLGQAVLRRKRVADMLGISLATLDRLRSDPNNGFPSAIRLSEQAVGFLWQDVSDWLAARPRVAQ